ncbi:hypothetical protein SAMN06265375_1047 [Muriicola jejuensis]|uniref:Uncharacterized protein n=1 Tax=Muriicola jejuensis TaxID=504488 RepID=A0A6P0UEH0_9FLAO|nr:hypothetical protein [Muriicola jejuensis]NER11022.1 hypothetical protein [Muriicola jejuensis]SMP22884.1 hypothetical protein SAMN06265375_1047 [Muriicola jejuensis]
MTRCKWFVVFIMPFLMYWPLLAQDKTEHSEMQQEIREMKQEIKELEAEIAEARVNDPDEVPELEKELASLKKIVASFEGMAGMNSKPVESVKKEAITSTPPRSSPVVTIDLKQPVTAPRIGEYNDRLLWYSGKRINDSTLVTTSSMVVQYQRTKKRVVAQPDKKSDPFEPLIRELEMAQEKEDELVEKFDKMKNGFMYYPELEKTIERYDDLNQQYGEIVNNVIDLPETPADGVGKFAISQPASDNPGANGPEENRAKSFLEETMEKAKRMFEALPPVEDFPPPPETDFSMCAACDGKLKEQERLAFEAWEEKFLGKEREILSFVLGAERQMSLLGVETENESVLGTKLFEDLSLRIDKKIKLLIATYGKKIEYIQTVNRMYLTHERQKALLGIEDNSSDLSSQIISLDKLYRDYFKEQKGLRNHDFVLNIQSHLSLERQKAILGIESPPGQNGLGEIFDEVENYNRFALTLDLDFDYLQTDDEEELELRATGVMATEKKTYTRLIPNECSYRMVKYDVDFMNTDHIVVAIPIKVISGTKTIRNDDDEEVTFAYSGPERYLLNFPEFKLDFCKGQATDSIVFMPLFGDSDYQIAKDLHKVYKGEMLPLANYMFIRPDKMEDNLDKGMDLAAMIMTTLGGYQSVKIGSTREKLKNQYEAKKKQDSYRKDINELTSPGKTVFIFDAQVGKQVIANLYKDVKYRIDENTELVKGLIQIKVEHVPME